MPQRYDVSTLKPAKTMPDGRLVVDAYLTRTGVFTYRNPDGSERREYRAPDEVFRADSLETLAMAPVANDHPTESVTAKNARKYAVGSVGEGVHRDGDHVAGRLVVHDESTIGAMRAGKRQVSCGYECDLVNEPGIAPSGERYDARQTNIVYNHVAIVDVGRAGSARVRMDAAEMVRADDMLNAGERDNMPAREFAAPPDKLPIENEAHVRAAMSRFGQTHFTDAGEKRAAFHKIVAKAKSLGIDPAGFVKEWEGRLDHADRKDSITMTLEQALAALNAANEKIGAEKARADAAEKARDGEKARADKAEAERQILASRLDAAEKERKDAIDGAPTKVKARVALETSATKVLGAKVKRADGAEVEIAAASDREIKLAVIKHVENVDCDVDSAGQKQSDVYIDACYDLAAARAAASSKVFQDAHAVIDASRAQLPALGARNDGGAEPGAAEKARQKMVDENRNQHAAFIAAK